MDGAELKEIRQRLNLSANALARALNVDARLILAWESGEQFPTKRHCEQIRAMANEQPTKPAMKKSLNEPNLAILADPNFWALFRKLLVHSELRNQVTQLASQYDDPVPT